MMTIFKYHCPHRLLLGSEQPRGLFGNGNEDQTPPDSHKSEANFDMNMVIILAALLCALLCALGVNSIVRCVIRCSRRFALETPDEVAARLAATTGLKKSALKQIPIAVYRPELNILATDCPICLGEFMDGEKVRILPKCNHGYHVKCIDAWLVSHSSCPLCRHPLLQNPKSGDRVVDVDYVVLPNHGNAPNVVAVKVDE